MSPARLIYATGCHTNFAGHADPDPANFICGKGIAGIYPTPPEKVVRSVTPRYKTGGFICKYTRMVN